MFPRSFGADGAVLLRLLWPRMNLFFLTAVCSPQAHAQSGASAAARRFLSAVTRLRSAWYSAAAGDSFDVEGRGWSRASRSKTARSCAEGSSSLVTGVCGLAVHVMQRG